MGCNGCGEKKFFPGPKSISEFRKTPIEHPRPSCRECVEKHIGAAMVLLSEASVGYPHLILAIGHLHEAAEESARAWPELSMKIRDARKALHDTGTFTAWDALLKTMAATAGGARHDR